MRNGALVVAAIMLLGACGVFAADEPQLIAGFDSIDGVSISYGSKDEPTKLQLNTDKKFISQGAASLFLAGVSDEQAQGNSYLGASIRFPEPIDFTKRSIMFDAWTTEGTNTRALYVRGFDAAGKCALSWNSWNSPVRDGAKASVELIPGASLEGFAWEPGVAESPNRDKIVQLQFIIGTHDKGTAMNVYLDNVRLGTADFTMFAEIEKPKPLYPDTALGVQEGPQPFILCPAADGWLQVANELRGALKDKLGLNLGIMAANEVTDEDIRKANIIALGAVSNNPRLLYLYSHSFTYADDLYPGPGGYVVQSIHDPWGTGKNVLMVGASNTEGAKAGIAELLGAIPESGIVPPVFALKLTGTANERFGSLLTKTPDEAYQEGQRRSADDSLEKGVHTGLFGQMVTIGSYYAQTRKDGYAELFVWLAKRAKEYHDSDPGTYGGPWGMDSDFRVKDVLPMWDQVEESPAISDEDRLAVTKILFEWASDVGPSKAQSVVGNERVRFNHQTFPALGCLMAGDYYQKYYNAVEAKRWISVADAAFQMQVKAAKSHEDCNGYQWLTLYHTMQYALAKPDLTFFENGNVRKCADFAILCMDNLGHSVTYGDTGAYVGWWSEMPFLRGALWYYRDARYAWALDKKVKVSGRYSLGEYYVDADGAEATDLIGSRAWPLDPYYYRTFGGPDQVPEEHAVDKVVFRNGFDPQDQYMLLDGLSNGGHKHLDGNSISRWSENDRIWLADADYILAAPKYHNGVLILKDGQSERIPDFVELEHFTDLRTLGASTTTYRNYAGIDWHRNIMWLKDKCFIVADRMVAKQDGDYSFRVVWNTIGEVKITDAGMSIHQDGQYAQVALTPDCKFTVSDDAEYGKNWAGYQHIEENVVRAFQGIRNVSLKEGEEFTLFSLLQATGEEAGDARLTRISNNWVAIEGLGEPMQVGSGNAFYKLLNDDDAVVTVAAENIIVSPEKLYAIGATEIKGLGAADKFEASADIEYNFGDGSGCVVSPSVTSANETVQARDVSGAVVDAGQVRTAIRAAIANAPGLAAGAGQIKMPRQLAKLWSYKDTLTSYLLTNNRGAFEAVDCGVKLTGSPEPLAANVFSQIEGQNTLDNITDGELLSTDGGAMWDDDQPVTLNLTFDDEYDIEKIVVKAWFATTSSKNKLYQLGKLQAEASSDGFAQDSRTVIDFTDTEAHGNWGEPGHAPQVYTFEGINAKANALRLLLEPRPGTAIYISELEVWGTRPGLEIDYATLVERKIPMHNFNVIRQIDLNADGVDEIVAGSSNGKVYAFAADGTQLWQFETTGAVQDVAAVDFNGDGKPAILAGSIGAVAIAISPEGSELWRFEAPYYKRAGHVRVTFGADLTGDGKQAAIIGSDNWHYYAINAEGKQIWSYESVHGSTAGAAGDLDGDGKDEILCGTEYYWWHVVSPNGKQLFGHQVGIPHANVALTANLDNDGKRSVIFGGADGNVHADNADGKARWLFNTGDEVTGIVAADIDGNGRDELLAGSMSFNVYAIDRDGKAIWRTDLMSEITALDLVQNGDAPRLLVGCKDGNLYMLDATNGDVLAGLSFDAPVIRIAAGRAQGGKPVAQVSTEAGELQAVAID